MTSSTPIPLRSSEGPPAVPGERRALIHPLSAGLLIAVDSLWALADWAVLAWIVSIPLSFLAVCIPAYLIQKHVNGDPGGRSLALGSLLGVLAAVPTPIAGTVVGAIVLAMAGFRSLRKLPLQ